MNLKLKQLLSNQTINSLKRITTFSSSTIFTSSHIHNQNQIQNQNQSESFLGTHPFSITQKKSFHNPPQISQSPSTPTIFANDDRDQAFLNEFLSRVVFTMRGKLNEAYPDCDKFAIDAMLTLIVEKLVNEMQKGGIWDEKLASHGQELSEDLWKVVLEVSFDVYKGMEKERKKEKMRKFLQSEDVKAMARFASEIGVRGDMLRELKFKWAREEMEKAEYYESLERLSKEEEEKKLAETETEASGSTGLIGFNGGLPQRHGEIKYKLYGLDLSSHQWKEVADRIQDVEDTVWPEGAKPITGKCKIITQKILDLKNEDDYDSVVSPLLNEWKDLLKPGRIDWICLLDKLKEKDFCLYLKVAEHVLSEPSFEANVIDYSKLIDAHAKEHRSEDMQRILSKMSENGMPPDVVTLTTLLHAYSHSNNLKKALETYNALMSQGLKPDIEIYNSMIMLYLNAGRLKDADSLVREMELRDVKPTEEIFMALFRAFAKNGNVDGAKKIATNMQFSGFEQTAESCTLLIEACSKSKNSNDTKAYFDYMIKLGFKPDDRCFSMLISAYEKNNELDKALDLLLQREKAGFELGVYTYSVLVDWFCQLRLVDEVEQILTKIALLGEAPPLTVQVSLLDMYAREGIEKKTIQALGVLEANKELLQHEDFEKIVNALLEGNFAQDATRMMDSMVARGFTPSENLSMKKVAVSFRRQSSVKRQGKN